jgi:DNA-binding LytR/AlgR family response regulator
MNTTPSRLSVLICDDDEMIREALRDVLQAEPDIDVVALARDTDEAIALAERHAPVVTVLDLRMPGGDGVRASGAGGPTAYRVASRTLFATLRSSAASSMGPFIRSTSWRSIAFSGAVRQYVTTTSP